MVTQPLSNKKEKLLTHEKIWININGIKMSEIKGNLKKSHIL